MHPTHASSWILAATLVALAVAPSCGPASAPPAEDASGIVLISIEAIRPDLLSAYGGDVPTPNLERLASRGKVFENTVSVSPMSRPAAATLLTGLGPDRTGVRGDTVDRLQAGVPTLAERFEAGGRKTAGIVSTPFCSYSSGLDRGFGLFDGPEEIRGGPERYFPEVTPGGVIAERFGEWLGTLDGDDRFFAWLHLADLHGPATQGSELPEALENYRAAVEKVDAAVGRVLDALEAGGRLDGSAVVVVGTHGQLLGEDDARGAAYWLRDETLWVPLIVKGPAGSTLFPAGSRSTDGVWLPDVAATVAAFGNVDLGDSADGVALTGPPPPDRVLRAWTWAPDDELAWPTLTAVDTGSGWRSFEWNELDDPAGLDREAAEALKLARARPAQPRPRVLPDELRARLEAEGLVTSWDETPPEELGAVERANFLDELQLARHHLASQRMARAKRAFQKLRDDHPDNLAVIAHRAYFFILRRSTENALKAGGRALSLYPTRPDALHWAGHAELAAGETARGELLIEAAMSITGPDADLLYDLACTRALQDDVDEALARLERSIDLGFRTFDHIEQDPDLASVRLDPRYVDLMRRRGR